MKITIRDKPIPKANFNSGSLYALDEAERMKVTHNELRGFINEIITTELKRGRN